MALKHADGVSDEIVDKVTAIVIGAGLAALALNDKPLQVFVGEMGNAIFDVLGIPDVPNK